MANTKSPGVIRYDAHTRRYEYWQESRCVAFSADLAALVVTYPLALVEEPDCYYCGRTFTDPENIKRRKEVGGPTPGWHRLHGECATLWDNEKRRG